MACFCLLLSYLPAPTSSTVALLHDDMQSWLHCRHHTWLRTQRMHVMPCIHLVMELQMQMRSHDVACFAHEL